MKIEQYLKQTKQVYPEQFPNNAIFPTEYKYFMENLNGCQIIKDDKRGNVELIVKYEEKNYKVEYKNKKLALAQIHKPPVITSKKKEEVKKEVKKNANNKRKNKTR